MAKITKAAVDGLEAHLDRPVFLWDDKIPGFGAKASPSGSKCYILKYRANGGGRSGPQRWLRLGKHGSITPDQARKLAQQASAAVARGEDPQADKEARRSANQLKDVWNRFEADILPLRKPSTQYDYKLTWEATLSKALGYVKVDMLTRSEVDRYHKSMRATPHRANRVLSLLSRLLTLAEVWDLRHQGTNPCRYVERFKEVPRNRYLSNAEIETLGIVLNEMTSSKEVTASAANAVRMLLFTGARRNEVLTAKWEWVDLESRVIRLPDSKTGAKLLFLSDPAMKVLEAQRALAGESEYLFPGEGETGHMINLRKSWVRLCTSAGLENVRLHDLRHTAASIAVGQGLSLPLIGRLLGHTQPRTTQRYAHVGNDPALEAADVIGSALSNRLSLRARATSPEHTLLSEDVVFDDIGLESEWLRFS